MFSIRVYFMHPRKGLIVRYLNYETYIQSMDAYQTITGERNNKIYTKDLYFRVATITHTALGELIKETGVETDLLSDYLHKTI